MSSIAEQVGRVVGGRYRLLVPVGAGASSQVFAAIDTRLGRRVAVKLLHPMLAGDGGFLRRFRAEARLAASLDHPHVMRVFDWGEEPGGPYLVLEFLGGGSLRALLDTTSRLSQPQVALLGSQAASGLAYAHRRGIVHRDIKPGNLLFDEEGHVRIGDFGVARALAEAALTEPLGAIFGTARYASPEQAEGRPLDDRTDVYSLALVLYEALTGHVPFTRDTVSSTLMARVGATLPPAKELGPFAPILAQAAISEPLARLDASALAADLDSLRRHLDAPEPLPVESAGILALLHLRPDQDPTATAGPPAGPAAGHPAGDPAGHPAGHPAGLAAGHPAGPAAGHPAGPAAAHPARPPAAGDRGFSAANGIGANGASAGANGHASPATEALPVVGDLTFLGEPAGPLPGLPVADPTVAPAIGPVAEQSPVKDPGLAAGTRDHRSGERGDRRHPRWRLVAIVAAVVLLLAGGATAGLIATRTRAGLVPRLISLTLASARSSAARAGFKVVDAGSRPSLSMAQGRIVEQAVPPGTRRMPGFVVDVVISSGLPFVTVPAESHRPLQDAMVSLSGAHLRPVISARQFSETVAQGDVISELPSSGQVRWGSKVALVVSSGPHPRKIPILGHGPYSSAASLLDALGLNPVESYEHSTIWPTGEVIGSVPAAGETVKRGSTVTVYVSSGPPEVAVPNITPGESLSRAEAALAGAGLVPAVYGVGSTVVTIYPSPHTLLRVGSQVDIYII